MGSLRGLKPGRDLQIDFCGDDLDPPFGVVDFFFVAATISDFESVAKIR